MRTWDVKATEKRRMPADTTDRLSWDQKLSQPTRWQALAVRSRDFLAGSDMVITCGVDALHATCACSWLAQLQPLPSTRAAQAAQLSRRAWRHHALIADACNSLTCIWAACQSLRLDLCASASTAAGAAGLCAPPGLGHCFRCSNILERQGAEQQGLSPLPSMLLSRGPEATLYASALPSTPCSALEHRGTAASPGSLLCDATELQ